MRYGEGGPEGLESLSNVIVSETFARTHDLKVGQAIRIGRRELVIIGVLQDFRNTIFVPTDLILNDKSDLNDFALSDPYDHYGSTITFAKYPKGTDPQVIYDKAEAVCKAIYPDFYGKAFFDKLTVRRFDKLFSAMPKTRATSSIVET